MKGCIHIFAAGALALSASAAAPLPPDGSFESGKLTVHWRSSPRVKLERGSAADGQWALHLPRGDGSECVMKSMPVVGGRRYSLRLMGRVIGPGAIAADMAVDQPHAVQRLRGTRGLAGWRIAFTDTSGRPVKLDHPRFVAKVIDAGWHDYREDFYAPAGAQRLELVFSNGSPDNDLWIDNIRLTPLEEGPLNLNPDVALGPYNFSGYNYLHNVHIEIKPDGDGYLDCSQGWIIGDPIPVEHRAYRFSFKGRQTGDKKASARINYYDRAMKGMGGTHLLFVGGKWEQKNYELVPPAGAAYVRIVFGGGDFDWFRFESVSQTGEP
jgi:hypothetical protein